VRRATDEAGIDPTALELIDRVGPERFALWEAESPHPKPRSEAGRRFEGGSVGPSCQVGSVAEDVGYTGAASGLAALVKAALCLYQQILPPRSTRASRDVGPRFWLHDRVDGPRRAAVLGAGVDGSFLSVVLEEVPLTDPRRSGRLKRISIPRCRDR
jgi:hypothetical protein